MLSILSDLLTLVLETSARYLAYLHVILALLEIQIAARRLIGSFSLNSAVIKDLVYYALGRVARFTDETVGPSRPIFPFLMLAHSLVLKRPMLKVIITGCGAEPELVRLILHGQTLQVVAVAES